MEDDQTDHGRRVAGRVYMQAQVASWLALIGGVWLTLGALSDSRFAEAGALLMLAATVGFGLLANAVLRR